MKILLHGYLAALICLFAFSCKKDLSDPNGTLAHIPADATSVTSINLTGLLQKVDWEELKKSDLFQKNKDIESNDLLANILKAPTEAGIDLVQNVVISTEPSDGGMINSVVVCLKNAGDFEKKLLEKNKGEVLKSDGFKYMKNGGTAIIAWNEHIATWLTGADNMALLTQGQKMFAAKSGGESLAKNKNVQKALDGKHDISSWFSMNSLAKSGKSAAIFATLELPADALENSYIHGHADFEKGKIVGHSDFQVSDALGEDFIGRFFRDEVKTDFSKILSKDQLAFTSVAALDFEGMDRFLSERPQSKGYADFVLKESGLNMADLMQALNGDLMVAGFGNEGVNPSNMLVAAGVKNRDKVRELLQASVKTGRLKEVEKDVYKLVAIGNADFYVKVNKGLAKFILTDDMLCYSSDENLLEKIKNGNLAASELADPSVLKVFNGQTLGANFTFDALKQWTNGTGAQFFNNIQIKANGKGADFIFETTEPESNSLNSIIKIMGKSFERRQPLKQEML